MEDEKQIIKESSNEASLGLDDNGTIPINNEDYSQWSVDDVITWCISTLELEKTDPLFQKLRDNDIVGDLLPELSLQDCQELCEDDLNKAIKFKILINKLRDTKSEWTDDKTQEDMVTVLRNLCTTTSAKMQEFQAQYTRLRMDVLEVMKTSSTSSPINMHGPPTTAPSSNNTIIPTSDGVTLPQTDYFDTVHHRQSPSKRESPVTVFRQPSLSRSKSLLKDNKNKVPQISTNQIHSTATSTANTPGPSPNEALKQLRASKEDSCERILKNAMKRHNLADQDWRQYVLVICYGDQERLLELNEKPVIIFKNLKQQGLHPAIMLRRRGDFEEVAMMNGGDNATPGGRL
ncbi:ste50p [Saccharomyces arboricola H-6]|uniref:Ste50p n=1 Tax=Saccharomyces arboricola (strain H-6 / AS 2.3317 / CBS 10644) TaxID=1160507 RepID=J8PQW9_SACAR|nr:ste50p [Saccharomyces arboricola H-6]